MTRGPGKWLDRRKCRRAICLLLAMALAMLLAACGGSRSAGILPASSITPIGESRRGGMAPALPGLQEMLYAELARLGKDPSSTVSAAPKGEQSAVFDLTASVVDPDGEGGDPPTGIELSWTEQLCGDYNQDGLVTANDLTPISQNWNLPVNYDNAADHGGIAYWPTGDPDDPAAGGTNWRRARVDGDRNKQVGMSDITPIGQHWQEKLSGYRVYRFGPLDTDWTLLPDPLGEQADMSIARPEVSAQAPVRYSFTDCPGYPGEYQYRVTAYALGSTGKAAMEAEYTSNVATMTLVLEGVDVDPPEWQGTAGIGSATANADGTVMVEWGEAVDLEHAPAPASPPVKYNVYYAAESPLDFATAAKVEDAQSPWSSGQLVDGREYYFAVRAQDSATPVKEDQNTRELAVTITGGVVDEDPPVWTEWYGLQDYDYYNGIRSLEVGDGQLKIVCADATDTLSPPVHYDLYYVSRREFASVFGDGDWPRPEAHCIEDILKEYVFDWDNRHEVSLTVFVRDGASPQNTEEPFGEVIVAPTDLKKIVLDPFVPGVTEESTGSSGPAIPDLARHKVLTVYSKGPDKANRIVYYLELDIESGSWEAEQLLDDPNSTYGYGSYILVLAPSGALWLTVRVYTGAFGVGYNRYYHRPANGSWDEVELPDPPDGFWNGILDQEEFPVFVSYGGTEEEGEYPLKLHFYESDSESWRVEVACDYAAYPLAFWRPDGVLQLVTTHSGNPADDIPRYVVERSPTGEWSAVLSGYGQTTALPVTTPQWDAQIAWAVLTTMRGELELLAYGEDGYTFLPVGEYDSTLTLTNFDYNKEDPYINQVWGVGADYHALPYWLYCNGKFTEFSYRAADELGNWQDGVSHRLEEASSFYIFGGDNDNDREAGQLVWLDPNTGHCAFVGVEDNLTTKRQQVYMLTTFGKGASVFDPLTWE